MLFAGAYRIDVTPVDLSKAFLAGFGNNRMAQGVLDPIYGRILYLSDGENEIAIACLDLIGIGLPTTRRIRSKVKGLTIDKVHVCCTHTHSGPDAMGLWGPSIGGAIPYASGKDPAYMEWLEDEVAYGIDKAKNLAKPVTLHAGTDVRPKQEWSRNIQQDVCDETLTALRFVGDDGDTVATVVHFGSHPEVLWEHNPLVSADFPSRVMDVVEERFGGVGVYWNGALGGMVTPAFDESMPDHKRPQWMREVGEFLGGIAVDVLENCKEWDCAGGLEMATKQVSLPLNNKMFYVAANMGILEHDLSDDLLATELSMVHLGPLRLALFPGEPMPAVGLQAREIIGGELPMLVTLANDEIGYILTESAYNDVAYKYEKSVSVGPATADRLLDGLKKLARKFS